MRNRYFVFDTNSIVSSFLFENGVPGQAFDLASKQGQLVLSPATAKELSEVLEREKFDRYVTREIRRELLVGLLEEAALIEVNKQIRRSRDPDDDKFLALALEAGAECIVSGDKDLLVLCSIQSIPILTARQFLERAE